MTIVRSLLLLFMTVFWVCHSSLAIGQDKGIPTVYMNDPAVDLTRNGHLLFPDEVHELYTRSNGKFDLSLLNPTTTSDLWKDSFPKELPKESLKINEMDEVLYHSSVLSPSGIFRFNILSTNGENKFYTMMLNKSVHTALLAKSILRKIGYTIPDIKHLPKIVLKFKDENEKKIFLSYLENVAFAGNPNNWIVEDLGNKLILQDLVVMESENIIYNLAFGITPDMIQGRRLLSALAVPMSLVNLTESINMLRWNAGVVNNKRIILYHDQLTDFQCTWDDGRWIARRIEKLNRADWLQIVESSHVPKVVQQILIEKLISRRNSIMKLFKIDAEELPVNGDQNNGLELVHGKLTQEKWPGYASRFAHGDPDSPLSDSDIQSWVKSRAISTAMELAVSQINQLPYLGTDVASINAEKYKVFLQEAIAQSVAENRPMEVPVKAWSFPIVGGQLIFSRNLVTGTYLGTDNLVQLVDTVGVAVRAGVAVGTMGISLAKADTLLPVRVSAGAQATFIRSYTHLRPVFNIKKSLKYPFKNIFVPLVKHQYGKELHKITETILDPNMSIEAREDKMKEVLKPFKDSLKIGESLLVTDTFSTAGGVQAGANIYGKLLSISLGLQPGHVVMSRFHVHRKTEDDFHVYKDIGHKGQFSTSMGLDTLIPILTISLKNTGGHARVKFYSINLNAKNPDVLRNASALRRAIVRSSTAEIEDSEIKPYVLKHSFRESNPSMNLLFWQFLGQNSSTDITVINPEGEENYYRRHYYGQTHGRNYQSYVNAVINHWVGLLFEKEAGLSDATGSNPGYSFKGQAKTKFLILDEELDKAGNVIEPFISLSRVRNGWSIDRKKAEVILEEMRQHYKFQFFNAPVLNDTNKIYLYNITVMMMFYENGIKYLLNLDEKRIKRIFLEYQIQNSLVVNPSIDEEKENEDFEDDKYSDTGVDKFLRLLNRYKRLSAKDKDFRGNKNLLKAIGHMEKSIYLPGIVKLMGGDENIYVTSKISGFREGDEDGDSTLISNSLGEYGSARILGPLVQVQRTTDMLEGEFFINWMMQRLI